MKMHQTLSPVDQETVDRKLRDFLPPRVFDVHAHLLKDEFASPEHRWDLAPVGSVLDKKVYDEAMQRWIPTMRSGSLYFGDPSFGNNRPALNHWVAEETATDGDLSRSLCVVSPLDDRAAVEAALQHPRHVGLKPYHAYSGKSDTSNVEIEEFAPDWMWELCHETNGIMMLHIMRDRAIADETNQKALRRLCNVYPNCRLVLAHIARSFNYRHAFEGLKIIADLENVWVDTAAISEMPAFSKAFEILGSRRVLFGTDYPISEMRGKCTATGDRFHWFYDSELPEAAASNLNLVGIESLLCLREACEESGLNAEEIQGVFHDNALELLAPHLAPHALGAVSA